MDKNKINQDALNDIYRNAHVALQSISDLLPAVEDAALKEELEAEYGEYESYVGSLAAYMKDCLLSPKDNNKLKKMMLMGSIKMKTMTDNSPSHLADMLVKGTLMGITDLRQMLTDGENSLSDEVKEKAKALLLLEEKFEERLKSFL